MDAHPRVGTPAPGFRLAAAGGGSIALADYAGRRSVLLWFSKGLHCPFCRRNMARLSQAYARFAERGAEVLQITHNTEHEAGVYFRSYRLATPYLCDADRAVHLRYGVELVAQSLGAVVGNTVTSCAMVASDLLRHGEKSPSPVAPILRMGAMHQSPQLVVAVDRDGIVVHLQPLGPFDTLPTVDELLARFGPAPSGKAAPA